MALPTLTPRLWPLPRHEAPDFSLSTVNIVLLLVLFFMVVGAPADQAERDLDLPITRDLPLDVLPRPLLLISPEGGDLVLDGVPVSRAALLQAIAAGGPQRLHLLVARDYPARALLNLTTSLSGAGAEVLLVTLRLPRSSAGHDPQSGVDTDP